MQDFSPQLEFIEEKYSHLKAHAEYLIIPPEREQIIDEFPDSAACELLASPDFYLDGFITAYAYYYVMRSTGSNHQFSEMIALRKPPRGMTDDIFFSGTPMLADQFRNQPEMMKRIEAARSMGYNPSPHDIYMPSLAKCVGDPDAWLSRTAGRSHIQKVLEQRGWGCNGHWEKSPRQVQPGPDKPLAEDVVRDTMRQTVADNPDLATLDRRELREQVIEKHGMK